MDISNYKTKNGIGRIYTGQAGSGKTTKLCNMVKDAKKNLLLSFTNKAIENVKKRIITTQVKNPKKKGQEVKER